MLASSECMCVYIVCVYCVACVVCVVCSVRRKFRVQVQAFYFAFRIRMMAIATLLNSLLVWHACAYTRTRQIHFRSYS